MQEGNWGPGTEQCHSGNTWKSIIVNRHYYFKSCTVKNVLNHYSKRKGTIIYMFYIIIILGFMVDMQPPLNPIVYLTPWPDYCMTWSQDRWLLTQPYNQVLYSATRYGSNLWPIGIWIQCSPLKSALWCQRWVEETAMISWALLRNWIPRSIIIKQVGVRSTRLKVCFILLDGSLV